MKGSQVIAMGRVYWEYPINKSISYISMDFFILAKSCQVNECKIDVVCKELKSQNSTLTNLDCDTDVSSSQYVLP